MAKIAEWLEFGCIGLGLILTWCVIIAAIVLVALALGLAVGF